MSEEPTVGEGRNRFIRGNIRADLRAAIPLTPVKISNEGDHFFGIAMNISRSGIFVQTPVFVDVGKLFSIEFTMPKIAVTVRCLSEVVWNRSMSLNRTGLTRGGFKFIDIDPDTARVVDEFVRNHVNSNF